jgi:hypothetical protein
VLAETIHLQTLDDLWTADIEAMRSGEIAWSPDAWRQVNRAYSFSITGLGAACELPHLMPLGSAVAMATSRSSSPCEATTPARYAGGRR